MNSSKNRLCPYCRKQSAYLPLHQGYTYVKHLHDPIYKPIEVITACKALTKRGTPCKLKGINGYCRLHNKSS